jgi:hypothetical protein
MFYNARVSVSTKERKKVVSFIFSKTFKICMIGLKKKRNINITKQTDGAVVF